MNPGLEAALDVDGCGGWVDPAGGYESKCGERPQERDDDGKP